MYSVQCPVSSVQCTVYSVQCPVYSVQCTVYSVQCSVIGRLLEHGGPGEDHRYVNIKNSKGFVASFDSFISLRYFGY